MHHLEVVVHHREAVAILVLLEPVRLGERRDLGVAVGVLAYKVPHPDGDELGVGPAVAEAVRLVARVHRHERVDGHAAVGVAVAVHAHWRRGGSLQQKTHSCAGAILTVIIQVAYPRVVKDASRKESAHRVVS